MKVKPIPQELLGDDLTLIYPTKTGATETPISNVRVERSESVEGNSSGDAKSTVQITVWVDYHRSTWAEFPIGARVRYNGELFEIKERRVYNAGTPHHLKFTANKTGDEIA